MGTETAPSATDGTIFPAAHVNTLADMMQGDFVPRNSSGAPTDIAGALGSTSYAWLKAFIESGYWNIGDIKPHHTYNGTAPVGHGWLLCNGQIVNQTNYDTAFGAGSWSTYIGSSDLDGLYTPDLTDKYLVGSTTTTQTGGSAITSVGNSGNTSSIPHNHQWYNATGVGSGVNDQTYDTSGTLADITTTSKTAANYILSASAGYAVSFPDSWTDNGDATDADVQPESIEVQYFIRII